MRTINHHLKKFTSIVLLLTPTVLLGVEATGPVLDHLIRSVENKLANLEASIHENAHDLGNRQSSLDQLRVRYETAATESERLEFRGRIAESLAQINATDLDLVTQTVATLSSVSRDLAELAEIFESGRFGAGNLERQRVQVRGVIRAIAPVLSVLSEGFDDPLAKQQARSTEQTLVMLYRQLEASSDLNQDSALNHIRSTIEALNDVAAQMQIVHQLLEFERYQLEVVAKVSMGERVLSRLAEARFGDRALIELPNGFQEGVSQRNREFGSLLRNGLSAPRDRARSASDRAVLSRIYAGEVP